MELPISPGGPGLAAGTLVTTPNGDKKIEEVVAGDLILSGIGNGKTDFYTVGKAMSKTYSGPMIDISIDSGNQFRATPNHICFSSPRPKISFEKDVMIVLFERDEDGKITNYVYEVKNPYDFEKSHDIDSAEEIARRLLRRTGGGEIMRSARFSEDPLQFMPATNLEVGMEVPVIDEYVEQQVITNITEEHYNGLIYNLNVPQSRNFAANGILVHDSTRISD